MLRIQTPLSDEVERLIHRTIGCCIDVHKGLGPGLLEKMYVRAVRLELTAQGISFEQEKRFPVIYRGVVISQQCVDFVVEGALVLEIKAVEHLAAVHRKQLLTYLRISKVPAGLLVNFNVALLTDGLRRVLL